jgi:hypothetical protein
MSIAKAGRIAPARMPATAIVRRCFTGLSPVRGISAWWIVDPRRLTDPDWAIFLFNVVCRGELRLDYPVEANPQRRNG